MFLAKLGITPAKFSQIEFPAHANVKCLLILLLLSGDIALNPGPINFGFVNYPSIRNKGPLIDDTVVSNNLDVFALAETHIQNSDTDNVLKSVTPPGFQLTHRPEHLVVVVVWASLLGKTYLLRMLMHQHIPLSKTLSFHLSLIQNHFCALCPSHPRFMFFCLS